MDVLVEEICGSCNGAGEYSGRFYCSTCKGSGVTEIEVSVDNEETEAE